MSNSGVPAFPPGVDWDFIAAREGAMLTGYVPRDASGNPDANSGVTIAVGFDLGGRNVAGLQALGLDPALVALLTPYLGLRGAAAQSALNAAPLMITPAQRDAIDAQAFNTYYNAVAANYNADAGGVQFQPLAQGAQTAIVSVAYQYGTNLARATPHFWKQVVTCEWQAAYNNLMNFGDTFPSRRRLEAAQLLTAIQSGTLPLPKVA
ncbi:MAG TPA: pesticin C-terminus-like muramidase [Rhizomicrobium sp.]|nr:pesticin C-terminus-like muramidase [Rhizomicrobium sp.]